MGERRIAAALGCSRETVQRYVAAGGWASYRRPRRSKRLDGLEAWLAERFFRHRGNADVVRQDLEREHGVTVSLRTVERAVAGLRQELGGGGSGDAAVRDAAGAAAADRLWRDAGLDRRRGGEAASVRGDAGLFAAGIRARVPPRAAIGVVRRAGGGVPAFRRACRRRCCWTTRGRWWRTTTPRRARCGSTSGCMAFARYWGFRPRACAPYRARTKGKDERGVGYVKRNAIAGHRFDSWAALEAHLGVVDARGRRSCACHGTTERGAAARFERDEAAALRPLDGRPPFDQVRELVRLVKTDCTIEVDTNSYSVPWRLIGETVAVMVAGGRVGVRHCGREVAVHAEMAGRRQRVIDRGALHGVAGSRPRSGEPPAAAPAPVASSRRCCARWRSTSRRRGRLVMTPDQASAGRLADPAAADRDPRPVGQPAGRSGAERELTLRETLAFLCEREIAPARRAARSRWRARSRTSRRVRELDGFDFAAQPSIDREADPRAGRLPLGGARRGLAAAGAARGRQDASGDRARPGGDPRRLLGAVRHRAGAGRRPGPRRMPRAGWKSGWASTPSPSC